MAFLFGWRMSTDERSTKLGFSVDGSAAREGFEEIKAGAKDMAQAVSSAGQTAAKGMDAIGNGGNASAQKVDAATRSLIASVQRTTAAYQAGERGTAKYFEAIAAQRGVSADALRPYLQQLEESRRLQDAATGAVNKTGVSAAQTAAALRGVPAQVTDIVTSLQAGQPVMTVLLQQGGQLKDMFGGVGPAVQALGGYVLGLVNPLTLAAGGAGVLTFAFLQGQAEATEFQKQLILTGNAAGVTRNQLNEMAAGVSGVVGTQGKAAEVLAALVSTGRISRDELQGAGASIVSFSQATGVAVDKLVEDFKSLGKDPAETIVKLNEKYNFLTASTYQQIQALKDQGREDDAAALAQRTYSDMLGERAKAVNANLGYIQAAWRGVTDVAKGAWDAMLGVGRDQTDSELLKAAQSKLESMRALREFNQAVFGSSQKSQPEKDLELYITRLKEKGLRDAAAATTAKNRQDAENAGIEAAKVLEEQRKALTIGGRRVEEELEAYHRRLDAVRLVTPKSVQLDPNSPAGKILDPKVIADQEKAIREQYADKGAEAANQAQLALQMAQFKAASTARLNLVEDEEKRLAVARAKGLLSEDDFAERKAAIDRKRLVEKENALRQEISLEEKFKPKDDAGRIAQQTKLVGLRSDLSSTEADARRIPLELQAGREARALEESRKTVRDWAQSWQQASDMSQHLADQAAAGIASMIVNPLDRARAEAEITVQSIERSAARLSTALSNQIDILRGTGKLADTAAADELQKQYDAIQNRLSAASAGIRDKAGASVLDSYLKKDIGTNFAAGFDKASQSLGVFVEGFAKLNKEQDQYNDARRAAGHDAANLAKVEAQHTAAQLGGYASLAGAAKGFFAEKTAGYKAMQVAEQAFRALELASNVARVGEAFSVGQANATAGVAAQANGDPYSAPFRMAAMAAIMASLGFVVAGAFSGGGGSFAPTNTGTGTVLGDSSAQSKSLTNSIDMLKDVDTATMRYSAQMLASLQSIESNIGGLATLLVQSGGLSASAAGVQTGFQRDAIGNSISTFYDLTQKTFEAIPVVGGVLAGLNGAVGNFVSNLFGTKTSIQGQGIFAGAQSINSILSNGFNASYYTDVEKKDKFLGITTSTSRSTYYSDADAQLKRQITTIFSNFVGAVSAAAVPLGISLDEVQKRLSTFVVDIGRIDLNGLSGADIKDRLTAVFGASGDSLASVVLSGFESFQHVGEGYFETVVRLASGVELARTTLQRLGVAAVDLSSITNKQGDVSAELVRESALAVEGLSGVGEIVKTLNGSASDIASTYKSLTDVRLSLRLLGLDATSVSFSLVNGAGGLQELSDAVAAYESGFLSSNDQVTVKAERMAAQFKALGLAMPVSSDAFVSLVKGVDTSSESGKLLLGNVLGLSKGFSELLGAIQDVGSGIADEIKRIQGLSAVGSDNSLASLQASFAINTAQARAGDQAAIDLLPQISQALLKAAEATAGSSLDVAVIQARTLASLQETLAAISDPTKRLSGIPGFASGGSFSGGWRIVGENGPELEATGAARIYDASQTAQILAGPAGNADLVDEVRMLRQVVDGLRDDQRRQAFTVIQNTERTAKVLERVTVDGNSISTTAAI